MKVGGIKILKKEEVVPYTKKSHNHFIILKSKKRNRTEDFREILKFTYLLKKKNIL